MKRKIILFAGIGLLLVGIAIIIAVPFFYYHVHSAGKALLNKADSQFNESQQPAHLAIPVSEETDTLFGVIQIPKLQLEAPILEGIQDKEINQAVGHLPTSVLPGAVGASILAAHNATWFRHVDELKAGDKITVKTKYGTFNFHVSKAAVVHVGDPVYNTTNPSLVLESCYPLNALYLTPYRYLVNANLDSSTGETVKKTPPVTWTYSPIVPNSIPIYVTYLSNNSLPLGTLTYSGNPSNSFIQSNAPLSASNSLVSLYLAWVHATSTRNIYALKQLGVYGEYNPFLGHYLSNFHYQQLFNETLYVNGNQLTGAVGTDIVRIHHLFSIRVTAITIGTRVVLESVKVTRLN